MYYDYFFPVVILFFAVNIAFRVEAEKGDLLVVFKFVLDLDLLPFLEPEYGVFLKKLMNFEIVTPNFMFVK